MCSIYCTGAFLHSGTRKAKLYQPNIGRVQGLPVMRTSPADSDPRFPPYETGWASSWHPSGQGVCDQGLALPQNTGWKLVEEGIFIPPPKKKDPGMI